MPQKICVTENREVNYVDYVEDELGKNEVLIETEYASGKHGTMLAMLDNENFIGYKYDLDQRIFLPENNKKKEEEKTILDIGTTGVGVIKKIGQEVDQWTVGDRVFGLMGVRETNICDQDQVWKLGDIDPLEALCIEPAYVSFHCIRESKVRYGDSIAVIGLGAIGLLTVNMAYRTGAQRVIAVDPIKKRRECAKNLGADLVLDPMSCNVGLECHKVTNGKGVDVAIELAGKYEALQAAIKASRLKGTVCSAGFYQGEAEKLWLGQEWHHNMLQMIVPHGCGWGHNPREYPAWDEKRAYDCMAELLKKRYLRASGVIDPVVSFAEFEEIFSSIESEPEEVIKYAVKF